MKSWDVGWRMGGCCGVFFGVGPRTGEEARTAKQLLQPLQHSRVLEGISCAGDRSWNAIVQNGRRIMRFRPSPLDRAFGSEAEWSSAEVWGGGRRGYYHLVEASMDECQWESTPHYRSDTITYLRVPITRATALVAKKGET